MIGVMETRLLTSENEWNGKNNLHDLHGLVSHDPSLVGIHFCSIYTCSFVANQANHVQGHFFAHVGRNTNSWSY